ncbi:hypothetical protein GCM10010365_45880 [Streptomyces poonensis]|uniref:Uncharacterized protein n=1 Tax=Streptomyces poonensis TaxID=68255 RepID=A0A918PRZ8_9ACTN|nr:hypothetical protein GCM10010365_45880 [Streptomyces poonensis]
MTSTEARDGPAGPWQVSGCRGSAGEAWTRMHLRPKPDPGGIHDVRRHAAGVGPAHGRRTEDAGRHWRAASHLPAGRIHLLAKPLAAEPLRCTRSTSSRGCSPPGRIAEWPPARHLSDGSPSTSPGPFADYHVIYAVVLIAGAAANAGATRGPAGPGRAWTWLSFVGRSHWLNRGSRARQTGATGGRLGATGTNGPTQRGRMARRGYAGRPSPRASRATSIERAEILRAE